MTGRILIIGGEPSLSQELTSALDKASFAVVDVPNFPEALVKLAQFKPDLVITGVVLPSGDGMEACYQLHNIFGIPVVLLGEDSSDEMWGRVMEAGADLYLVKPFSYPELIARVKAILRRYRRLEARHIKMDSEQEFLTTEDRTNGFSIVADDRRNMTLLKWGKPVAWFSAVVPGEALRQFLELIKVCEKNTQVTKVSERPD